MLYELHSFLLAIMYFLIIQQINRCVCIMQSPHCHLICKKKPGSVPNLVGCIHKKMWELGHYCVLSVYFFLFSVILNDHVVVQ